MTHAAKTVLITGSEGFTGQYMAAEMQAAGYHVVGLGSKPGPIKDYYQVNLLNSVEISQVLDQVQPDIVIHLAAIAFVGHGDANAFYQVNLQGTRNLLAALDSSDKTPEAILLASSANVYGNSSEGMLSESTRPAPANDYAVSKLAMEYMAHLWQDRLPIIITRPFNYTGVGQADNFLIPKIVSHFKEKKSQIELGNIDVWRDFSDVRSIVNAYRRLIEAKVYGYTVNVCSGKAHSLREVVQMMEKISDYQIEIKVNPAFMRAGEVKTLCGNADLLTSLIGNWQTPSLQETLEWMTRLK